MQELLAVVDLKRIRRNAELIKSRAKRPLLAVVKDDAYGHGAIEIAHTLSDMVWAFAVATVEEGVRLRVAGIENRILVLTPLLCRFEAERLSAYDLTATLSSARFFTFAEGLPLTVHLAVNTGMNRYGVRPSLVGRVCRTAAERGILVAGVYSHLYAPSDEAARREQRAVFSAACEKVRSYFPEALCHLSATGGILSGELCDAVRAGISLYGYLPEGFEGRLPVRPAMKIYAAVAESRARFGGGAGYQSAPAGATHFHTLRAGYGDGFFREGGLGAVGKLCMDACVREGYARAGERRLILKDAAAYAREHGTTAYEVLVRIGERAAKTYLF